MGRPREISDEEILEQARASFLESGPTLSAAAIARKLGISEGTLFNRFSTKEDLLRKALGAPEPRWLELLVQDTPDLREHLITIGKGVLAFFQQAMPAISLLRAAGLKPHRDDVDTENSPPRRIHSALSAWLEQEQARGRLRKCSPTVSAQVLLGSLHAHAMMQHIWGESMVELDDEAYVRELIDTLFCELTQGPEGPHQ